MRGKRTIEDILYAWSLALAAAAAAFLSFLALGGDRLLARVSVPCLFRMFTGLYCPGCGGTRAGKALLDGFIVKSFLYHPLLLYAVTLFLAFFLSQTLSRLSKGRIKALGYHDWFLWVGLGITACNFILRNILLLCGIPTL